MSRDHKGRAGIYCRASSDPRERGLSVETQEEDGRAWCAANGYTVAWVVVDNNYSASRWASKQRPGYQRVQANLAGASPVDVLVARDGSRLQRDLAVYIQVRDLAMQYGVRWAYNGREFDLSRTDDRFSTGLDALLAERAAGQIRDDVMGAVDKRVRDGKPHGRVAYGYRPVYDPHTGAPIAREEDPGAARVVRRVVDQVLRGMSIYAIAAQLDREGEPAPEAIRRWRRGIVGPSRPWTHRMVRDIALNPTYAGLRSRNGEIQHSSPGRWPALVTVDEHHEVTALLKAPGRRVSHDHAAKHLLSGIARCGICGSAVGAITNRGALSYACKGNTLTWRGSRHVVRRQAAVDRYVTECVLRRLERPDAAEFLTGAGGDAVVDEGRREMVELEARLEEIAETMKGRGGRAAAMLADAAEHYEALLESARARAMPQVISPLVRQALEAPDVWVWWYGDDDTPALTVAERRTVVRALVSVTIHRSTAPQGSKGFDPSAIGIRWR